MSVLLLGAAVLSGCSALPSSPALSSAAQSLMTADAAAAHAAGASAADASAADAAAPPAELTFGQVAPKVVAALAAARTLSYTGTESADGRTFQVTYAGRVDGSNFTINVVLDGQAASLRRVSGTTYVRASSAFWRAVRPESPVTGLADKWARLPASGSAIVPHQWLTALGESLETRRDAVPVTRTTHAGRPVLSLSTRRGGGALLVDATTFLPVRLSEGPDTVAFSDWNSVPAVVAPPAKDIVSM